MYRFIMLFVNQRLLLVSFLLVLIVNMSSCRQILYYSDRANTPGMTKAMEAKATFSIRPNTNGDSRSSNSKGYSSVTNNGGAGTSIDLAFSPVKHLGIIGSYRNLSFNSVRNYQDGGVSGT